MTPREEAERIGAELDRLSREKAEREIGAQNEDLARAIHWALVGLVAGGVAMLLLRGCL